MPRPDLPSRQAAFASRTNEPVGGFVSAAFVATTARLGRHPERAGQEWIERGVGPVRRTRRMTALQPTGCA
ncbi:hypothetical protein ADK64_08940 [Streptomyces sp. MMG1121]|nr:hypothetical protein ADK64_08940 [Streptomyces sp. MMG1121]